MIIIPTDSTGTLREYTQQVSLDGAKFTLKFSWNTRTERWVLSIYQADDSPVIEGIAVTCGVDLLRGSAVQGRPAGVLFAAPTDASPRRPDFTGLGTRVQLYYAESDEEIEL